MRTFLHTGWARLLACLLCTLTIIGIVISGIATMFYLQYPDEQQFLEEGNRKLALNYLGYILSQDEAWTPEEYESFLAETNLELSVIRCEYDTKTGAFISKTPVFNNLSADSAKVFESELYRVAAAENYSITSLYTALVYGDYYVHVGERYESPIEYYCFDVNTGVFYAKTYDDECYTVESIVVFEDNVSYDYKLRREDGKLVYYNSYYARTLDISNYRSWGYISIEGKHRYLDVSQTVDDVKRVIYVIEDSSQLPPIVDRYDHYIDNGYVCYNSEGGTVYEVELAVKKELVEEDFFLTYRSLVETAYKWISGGIFGVVIFVLLFLGSLVALWYTGPDKRVELPLSYKLPPILWVVVLAIFVTVWINVMGWIVYYSLQKLLPRDEFMTIGFVLFFYAVFALMPVFAFVGNILTRIRAKSFWRYTCFYYVGQGIKRTANSIKAVYRDIFDSPNQLRMRIGIFAVISILELFVALGVHPLICSLLLIFKLIECPVLIFFLLQFDKIRQGAKRIASGDTTPIDTDKLVGLFREQAEDLNQVGEGITLAVNERMKSEHFKSELITNVSHDIKTPLTSIINYVDLIKKEEIQDEKLAEYVEVLDRQSTRLKKLVEDLIEASKASSGTLPVVAEVCDMKVLLGQAVGEFEEKLAAKSLEVVISQQEEALPVLVDGRHLWRVFDNLLNNIYKYSQEGTRVYVNLEEKEHRVQVTFRNISKNALNLSSEELMQRFVRGDSSRHTEGSGLGLSIAQSLTELMGGSLKLETDGDLFKVILSFAKHNK